MIYKAFLYRQEITGFPVKGKETSEIWGGNTLLWEKSSMQDYFKFEYESVITFMIKGSNISVDWGDGMKESFANEYQDTNFNNNVKFITHTPISEGRHISEIRGIDLEVRFGDSRPGHVFSSTALTKVLSPLPRCTSNYLPYLFYGCKNLESVTEDLFKNCKNATNALETFMATSKLKNIPGKLFDYIPKLKEAVWTFRESGLESVPGKLFSKCEEMNGAAGCFSYCGNLKTTGDGLLSKQKMIVMHSIFSHCPNLVKVNDDLFANADPFSSENDNGFHGVFYGCAELLQAPNFYQKFPTLTDPKRTGLCYYECKKLPFYASLPERWR